MYRILKLNCDQQFSDRENTQSLLIEKDMQISSVSTFNV